MVDVALCLLSLAVPQSWKDAVGPSAPPTSWPLKDWLQDLLLRYTFLDRVLYGGLAKTATYWLGGFFNPAGFLNIMQQVYDIMHTGGGTNGHIRNLLTLFLMHLLLSYFSEPQIVVEPIAFCLMECFL